MSAMIRNSLNYFENFITSLFILLSTKVVNPNFSALLAGALEYANCISVERKDLPVSVLDITLNHLMAKPWGMWSPPLWPLLPRSVLTLSGSTC